MPPLGLRKPLSAATREALAAVPVKPDPAEQKAERKAKLDLLAKHGMSRRDITILSRKWQGESMASIGSDHGLSRERVRQIVDGLEATLHMLEEAAQDEGG